MFSKSFLICFVCLSLLQIDGRSAEGITLFPMEVLQRKLGQITDRILSWSPFGSVGKNGGKQNDEIELDLNEKNSNLTIKRHYFYGCECKSYFCSCCSHIEVAKTSLNHTGCLNMTYEGAENQYRMNIKFDLNERIYYNNSISMVKQPEEMCAQYNSLNSTKLCLKFYRLDARNRSLSGSADLIVKETAADTELSRIKLGTFRFGNGTQYYEKNLMKIYLNRNKTPYDISHMSNRSNMSSLEQFYESYDNFINKLNYFPLPKFSFNFQPDRLIDNLYNSLFSSRMIKKKSNETLPSSLSSSSSSSGSSIDYVTPSMESREADFNEKRGYYRVHEQP